MNDKDIHIDGLTKEQVKLLDEMWSLKSSQEFDIWYDSLSDEEVVMADQLKELLIVAVMDAVFDKEAKDLSGVKNYLKKFMLKK